MRVINITEAQTHFSKLIDAVISGEEIWIALAEKPVAKLIPICKKPQRRFGVMKGKIKISKDFDASLPGNIRSEFEIYP